MDHSFEFQIIRYEPDARRGERVNIGLLVHTRPTPQVHLIKSMNKALALSPQVRFHANLQAELTDMFADLGAAGGLQDMRQFAPFSLSERGSFYCKPLDLQGQIEAAMKRLVNPARRPSAREGNTRLHTEIKRQFKSDGVLASDPSEITQHKVVADFEFPGDEELAADFAFKNGAWLLTQVLDYRTTTVAAAAKKIREVSLKAIALDQAAKEPDRLLGEKLAVKTSAVVWVPEELDHIVGPQIDILADYCDTVYRFQNQREQAQYWASMNRLTKQYAEASA
jgi:hypothetical protein